MGEISNARTESILEIVKEIDSGKIVLPEFQRDFVWDTERTYDLFDSLIKDVFIGSIIYGVPSFALSVRELDNRPRKGVGSRKKLNTKYYTDEDITTQTRTTGLYMVLDGQQRITSIYRALKGTDSVWISFKTSEELAEDEQEKKISDISLESLVFEISGKQNSNRISISMEEVYQKIDEGLLEEDLKLFFEKTEFACNLPEEEKRLCFKSYVWYMQKIEDMLKSDKMVAYFLLDMSADKFALFFERSNSRGISLSFIDILVAKLINGFNLKKEIENFEEKNTPISLNRELIARAIAYLVSDGKKVDKKYILANLSADHFDKYWKEITQLYVSAINYLINNHYILSMKWIPYPNTIIPIMMFLKELPQSKFSEMTENQRCFLDCWYWNSVMSQRYVSSSNETIILDSQVLSRIARGEKITDSLYLKNLKCAFSGYEDILVFNKKGSAIYVAILNFINFYSKGLLNWNNCSKITFSEEIDDHHIFPKKYLENLAEQDIDRNQINCVANRTLMPKITNIKVGKKSPDQYLKQLQTNNANIAKILENHMIPTGLIDGTYNEFYDIFLEDRAKLIYNAIKETILDNREMIEKEFVKEIERPSDYAGSIDIFGTYHKRRVEASFNIDSQYVLYNGIKGAPSTTANQAKIDLGGKETVTTNGWKWWKYQNNEGEESPLEDYRY